MALDAFSSVAGRNAAKAAGFNSKVAVPAGKPMGKTPRQPVNGKLNNGSSAMGGNGSKGQAVKTVKSNPVSGKNVQGNTSMGSGSVMSGFVS